MGESERERKGEIYIYIYIYIYGEREREQRENNLHIADVVGSKPVGVVGTGQPRTQGLTPPAATPALYTARIYPQPGATGKPV